MPKAPQLIRTVQEMRYWRSQRTGVVGFVPTMGALQEGHARLLPELRPRSETLILSIFVNPKQFGAAEDLSRYPRTFDQDMKIAQAEGVDAVFYPEPSEIYPEEYSTDVEETMRSQGLCGLFRPGHFKGVATIVLKLFNIIQPQVALFGMKDAQQFFVIEKMVKDLNVPVVVGGHETVREPDGLAMSSRNAYLSAEERQKAPELYRILKGVQSELYDGKSIRETLGRARLALEQTGWTVQYLDCVEVPNLQLPSEDIVGAQKAYLVATAAFLGKTRLIDNVILNSDRVRLV